MSKINYISLLGLSSEDPKVIALLKENNITRKIRITSEDTTDPMPNKKGGVEITFTGGKFTGLTSTLPANKDVYAVLTNIRFYGIGAEEFSEFKTYKGELPHGLKFDMDKKQVSDILGEKPAKDNKETHKVRWDLKDHTIFITFNKKYSFIHLISIQLPLNEQLK